MVAHEGLRTNREGWVKSRHGVGDLEENERRTKVSLSSIRRRGPKLLTFPKSVEAPPVAIPLSKMTSYPKSFLMTWKREIGRPVRAELVEDKEKERAYLHVLVSHRVVVSKIGEGYTEEVESETASGSESSSSARRSRRTIGRVR